MPEFAAWPMPADPFNTLPGTPENLAALNKLLRGWKCCGAPNLCGATCQDSELSAVLAQAARVVAERLEETP